MEIKILFPRLQYTRELWTIIVVAILLFVAGTGLLYISAIVIDAERSYSFVSEFLHYDTPAYMLVAAGLMFYVIAILAVVGVARDSKFFFACSLSFYLPIILLLAAAGALSYTYRREMFDEFSNRLEEAIKKYDPGWPAPKTSPTMAPMTAELDKIQNKFLCCGRSNFMDWVRFNPHFKEKNNGAAVNFKSGEENYIANGGFLPDSCCWGQETCQMTKLPNMTQPSSEPETFVYKRGCLDRLNETFQKYLSNMCWLAAAYLFIIVIIMMGTSIIMCQNANRDYYLPVKPSIET